MNVTEGNRLVDRGGIELFSPAPRDVYGSTCASAVEIVSMQDGIAQSEIKIAEIRRSFENWHHCYSASEDCYVIVFSVDTITRNQRVRHFHFCDRRAMSYLLGPGQVRKRRVRDPHFR